MHPQSKDKQLQAISFEMVLEKKTLDQALNAKEFAICAGVSYSIARKWFRLPGFPVIQGVVFWKDFVKWREKQREPEDTPSVPLSGAISYPSRASQILRDI